MENFNQKLINKIGSEKFNKLSQQKIGIAGCGGLGSNCAQYLVRSGFTQLKLVDYDCVEISNLNRQFYFSDQIGLEKTAALKSNLLRINPQLKLDCCQINLSVDNILSVFADCAIVVEAFDNAASKKMLVENLLGKKELVVSASGVCGWGDSDAIKTQVNKKGFILIGDLASDCQDVLPLAPRVNVAAAKQADAVLNFVLSQPNK